MCREYPDQISEWNSLKERMAQYLSTSLLSCRLYPCSYRPESARGIKEKAKHRDVRVFLEGRKDISVLTDPEILGQVLEGLVKNAIENTPDEGMVEIIMEQVGQKGIIKVRDFGIGITEENRKYIFDGLFATQETDLYSSKKPTTLTQEGRVLTSSGSRSTGSAWF